MWLDKLTRPSGGRLFLVLTLGLAVAVALSMAFAEDAEAKKKKKKRHPASAPAYNVVNCIPDEFCVGTDLTDVMAGTDETDFIVGTGGNDFNYGYGGDDFYLFETGWGADTIIDSAGFDGIVLDTITSDLTIDLVSKAGAEVTDGTNTINWEGNVIDWVFAGSGDDTIKRLV